MPRRTDSMTLFHRSPDGLRSLIGRLASGAALLCVALAAHAVGIADNANTFKDNARDGMAQALGYHAMPTTAKAGETVIGVVEYYNAALQHYFITAEPAEIANLDGGAFGGAWKRTGQAFNAWALASMPSDAVPVCRFFGTDQYRTNGTRIGPNSHFYTADPAECAFVKTGYQSAAADGRSYPAWTYEADVFAVKLAVGGSCPAGTTPLYRAYNDGARGDPNHRYSTNTALLTALVGWTYEGLVMCVPGSTGTSKFEFREIRGCDNPGCQVPLTGGSGVQLVDLVAEIANVSTAKLAFVIPSGFVFKSVTGTYQDGLLLDPLTVDVPPGGSTRILIRLYCLQHSRAPATTAAIYSATAVTADPGLLAITGLPRPYPVEDTSLTATATQLAVWEVTDGKGLSASQLNLLRNVYALPESDPAFIKAMTDFLDTLTVIKPPA